MAKEIKERLEAACAEAGLDRALERRIVERVLAPAAAGPASGDGAPDDERRRDEAELARIREEAAKMAETEEEMKELLGVTSRDAIVPALEAVLEKLRVLKAAAGFPPGGPV